MNASDHWKNGVALKDADLEFAPRRLKSQYNAAQSGKPQEFKDKPHLGAPASLHESPEARSFSALVKNVHIAFNAIAAPSNVRFEMRNWLLEQLTHNRFAAYGYYIPVDRGRRPDDIPVQIPADVLKDRFIKWDKSEVDGAGLKFVSVRIIRVKRAIEISAVSRSAISNLTPNSKPESPQKILSQKNRVGRPDFGKEIYGTYRQLNQEGKIDFTKPMTVAIKEIQRALPRYYPDAIAAQRQPDQETIRRRIVAEFKERKKKASSSKL